MSGALRVLLVEDSADDEFLTLYELKKAGYHVTSRRIHSRTQMEKALDTETWDLIISDFNMPGFSGAEALQVFQERGMDCPFIILSGIIGEDTAVEMMRQGAHDYIMKGNLKKLPLAVDRELREAQSRLAKRKAEDQVYRLNRVYKILSGVNQAIVRIGSQEDLFKEIGNIAVSIGQFSLVFVTKSTPTGPEVLSGVPQVPPLAEVNGLAVESEVIRTGQAIFRNKLESSVYGSVGVLPLFVQGELWGTLSFYTALKNVFTLEETQLLSELSMDLSFALEYRIKEDLRRSSDQFNSQLVSVIPGFVYRLRNEGGTLSFPYVSSGVSMFPGVTAELAMGDPQTILGRIDKKQEPLYHSAAVKALEEGRLFSQELCLHHPDGSTSWLLTQAIPQKIDQEKMEWIGIGVNITEKKVGDQAIQDERVKLEITLQNIGEGVVATDESGAIVLMNATAEEILGKTFGDVRGKSLRDGLGAEFDIPMPELNQMKSMSNFLYNRGDAQVFHLECLATSIRQSGGGLGQVLILRDVTQRDKIEERLRQSEKMESIGLLAGGIAHDFNNLLTGIFGFLQLAKMNSENAQKVVSYLDSALTPFNRARNLTQQLLTFSKGGQPLKKRFKVKEMLQNLMDFTFSGSSVVTAVDFDDNLYDLMANEAQISQVFENLLINAKQAMPDGGAIRITARNHSGYENADLNLVKGNYLEMVFEDNGPGIAGSVLEKIFDPFFTTKKNGTGLGLSICYSIVKKHGGLMEAGCGSLGGALFRIYLPAVLPGDDIPVPEASCGQRGHGRILFLDDEPYARSIALSMLEELGYSVEAYGRSDDLVTVFEKNFRVGSPFDLVILDLTIKGGAGGIEVLKQLKAIDPQIRAVASSGYSNEAALSNPQDFGFVESLPKPFTSEELSAVLVRAMGVIPYRP